MARPDPMLERIEAFNRNHGGRVIVRHVASGYSLHSERSGGPAEANRRGRQGPCSRLASRKMGRQRAIRRPNHDARPRPGLYLFKPVLLDLRLIQPKNAQSRAENIMKFAEFQHRIGQIKVKAADWKEIFLPDAHGYQGS
jgi:hypothetical protein